MTVNGALEPSFSEPTRKKYPDQLVAMIRQEVPLSGLPQFFDRAYTEIIAALNRVNLTPAGPALAVSYGQPTDTVDLGAAFPIEQTITSDGDVTAATIPACEVATLTVNGSYDLVGQGYEKLQTYIKEIGMELGPIAWEEYVTMPEPGSDPSLNVTQLCWMII